MFFSPVTPQTCFISFLIVLLSSQYCNCCGECFKTKLVMMKERKRLSRRKDDDADKHNVDNLMMKGAITMMVMSMMMST